MTATMSTTIAPTRPRQDRRSLLSFRPTLVILAALCLASLLHTARAQPRLFYQANAKELVALQTCLLGHHLDTVSAALSDDHTYYTASRSDNLVFHYNPAAIVYATSAKDVQAAIRCANKLDGVIPVVARSGGHSFGGYGSGGRDGALVIDVGALNTTESIPQKRIAHVGAGTRLGDVVKELWSQHDGKMALAHGTCPTVGIGGHATCGGFGPTSRAWGMTMDHILEAEVVLADGSLVTASPTQNADLLWAIKGAAAYVGIVTRFTFLTHDASAPVTFFEYRWTPSLTSSSKAASVFSAIQSFALSKWASAEMGFHVQVLEPLPDDPEPKADRLVSLHMRGSYLGPLAEFQRKIEHLWTQMARHGAPKGPDRKVERQMSFYELMEEWDDFAGTAGGLGGGEKLDTVAERRVHNNFVAQSLLTRDHKRAIKENGIKELFAFVFDKAEAVTRQRGELSRRPAHSFTDGEEGWYLWNLFIEFYGGETAGYRTRATEEASVFPWRDGLWLIQASVGSTQEGTIPHQAHAHLNEFVARIRQSIAESGIEMAGYSCYLDPDLDEATWRSDYYGANIGRLEDVKAKWDGSNLLRNPQSLGNSTEIRNRRRGSS